MILDFGFRILDSYRSRRVFAAAAGCLACASILTASVVIEAERTFAGLALEIQDLSDRISLQNLDFGDALIDSVGVSVRIDGLDANNPAFNGDYFISIANADNGFAVLANRVGRTATSGAGSLGYSDNGFNVTFDDVTAGTDIHSYRDVTGSLFPNPVTGTWQSSGRTALPEDVTAASPRNARLDSFEGTAASGDWWLTVSDVAQGGSGVLKEWGVQLRLSAPESGTVRLSDGDLLRADDFDSVISSNLELAGDARVTGNARIELLGSLSGSGNLIVDGGSLMLSENSENYLGEIQVEDGRLHVSNTIGHATGGDVFVEQGGAISGSGSLGGSLFIASGGALSPGESPGLLHVDGGVTWESGGEYRWEINLAGGQAGVDPGWPLITMGGDLSIAATEAEPFVIRVISLDPSNEAGLVADFTSGSSYQWLIAQAQGEITGFSTERVLLDLSEFENAIPDPMNFSLSVQGGDLFLNYIPEPGTYALLAGLAGLGYVMLFRRRARRKLEG